VPRPAPYVFALAALVVLAIAVAAIFGGDGGESTPVPVEPAAIPTPPGTDLPPLEDPFSYDPDEREDFEARAAAGNAHALYALSPGGAVATAKRVALWRPQVEAAAAKADVDADRLEALVFLESAGRPDAVSPAGTEGAVGLTQIVAETAVNLLGMRVDVERSRHYSRRLARVETARSAERLRAARARVDERFVPDKALAATGRYLRIAEDKFHSEELAFVSYHMGMGNLESVLRDYAGGPTDEPLRYAQVYFDSSPLRHPAASARLQGLGDDSSNYLWKLMAAEDIMRLSREDPDTLGQTAFLQTSKNSAEEVLHPPGSAERYATPEALQNAWDAGTLVAFPQDIAATGLRLDRRMGELAPRLERSRTLYRGLRPEALALALYVGASVRAMSGDPASALTVTSTVRDDVYQRLLVRRNAEATRNYSLHTTGWAFDVARRYSSRRQALAFQFVLDRLRSLNLIAWVREPAAIHITAATDAGRLDPLLDRILQP
jgi:soluble lytic murein transglycosylase-like protein